MRVTCKKLVIFSLPILLVLTGCTNSDSVTKSSKQGVVTIGESDILPISIPYLDSPSTLRIIALANGSAEILVSMGLKDSIVGRDIASTTKSLSSIPEVTSGHQVIPEKVISLKPDIVLIDASTGPANALAVIQSSGIKIITIPEAWTLTDISTKVLAVGKAIAAPKTAQSLANKITSSVKETISQSKIHPRIAFLYLRGANSIYLMGGPGSGADSLIHAIGAIDVGAQSLPHPFNSLTSEALVTTQPDVILLMVKGLESVGGVTGLLKLPGIAQTPAGKYQRIIAVDDSLLLSFGPRTPGLVIALAKALTAVMSKGSKS